jgi:hypothetical protein
MFIGGEHTGWRSAVLYTFVEQVRRHGVSGVRSALHRDLLQQIHKCHSFRIYDTYEFRPPCGPACRCGL